MDGDVQLYALQFEFALNELEGKGIGFILSEEASPEALRGVDVDDLPNELKRGSSPCFFVTLEGWGRPC